MGFFAAALTFVGFSAATAATIATVVTAVVATYTLVTGVKAYKQAKSLANSLQSQGQEILANKTSAGGKIPVVYGSRRVGAQIVFMDTAENESKDF